MSDIEERSELDRERTLVGFYKMIADTRLRRIVKLQREVYELEKAVAKKRTDLALNALFSAIAFALLFIAMLYAVVL